MSTVIVLIFPSRGSLMTAVDRVNALGYINIKNTALISKADDGEITVSEDDVSPVEGSVTGGTLGSLMGALGVAQLGAFLLPGVGPIIAVGAGALIGALVGGATGGLTASLIDFGFDNAQLEALADRLQHGRTALVVELEERPNILERLREDLKDYEVEIMLPES
ncbi:MAG: hypothetical protein DIU68_001900 [Chloroflexota bacterium]|nr:MAG: hypothetical protein DIU68_13020 [Chloroflexota bacterium]